MHNSRSWGGVTQVCGSSRPLMMGADNYIDIVHICQSCCFCDPCVGCISCMYWAHRAEKSSDCSVMWLRWGRHIPCSVHCVHQAPSCILIELDYARLVGSCFKTLHQFVSHLKDSFSNIWWLTETFKETIPVSAVLKGLASWTDDETEPLLFFTQPSHTPFLDMYVQKTTHPHPKTPLFLAWTWKWAKWSFWTPLGNMLEQWAKLF